MRRRLLNITSGNIDDRLIFTIDTSKDSGDDFTIPIGLSGGYDYSVDWGDGSSVSGQSTSVTHTYSAEGIYQILISGTFKKFFFNNGGSKLKIISIDQWGDVGYEATQQQAFYGCENLQSIAEDIEWMNTVTNASFMFYDASLTSIPSVMTLDALINADYMFYRNNLTALPSGMTLSNVTVGQFMFRDAPLTSLPSGMDLDSINNGTGMFRGTDITALPSGMTLDLLTDASTMFAEANLTSLPSGMVLGNLLNGSYMFRNNLFTSIPNIMSLASLTSGLDMFLGVTINTADYSILINNIDSSNSNTGVTFHGGNSKYNSGVSTQHNNLTSTKSWTITDGGLE